jgi:two-component system OmpR family sensor kinase
VLILLLGIVVTVVTMRQILFAQLDVRIKEELTQEVREFRSLAGGIDPQTGRPFGGDIEALFDTFLERNVPVDPDDEQLLSFVGGELYDTTAYAGGTLRLQREPELFSAWSGVRAPSSGTVASADGEVRYLAVPVRANEAVRGVFTVAILAESDQAEIDEAVRIAALVGGAALLLGSLLAYLAVGRVLGPLRELTATAQTIEESDLTARIEVSGDDELAELGRTFNAMLDRLEGSFDGQRALVSDIGHELRTPITIVRGHLELLGDDPEERRETIELVSDELDRMSRLVNDLLTLARAERPDFLRPEPVEVEELLEEILAKARTLGEREWGLATGAAPRQAVLDPQRITQAMINLIDNALHHTEAGGSIEIGAAAAGDGLRLWVADGGRGIDRRRREQLFERFERGAAESLYAGTGLGLAIVKAIAEAHGGTVSVGTAAAGGAEFSIAIPLAGARRRSPEPEEAPL